VAWNKLREEAVASLSQRVFVDRLYKHVQWKTNLLICLGIRGWIILQIAALNRILGAGGKWGNVRCQDQIMRKGYLLI